jgi:mannose-6-phosphate isomerase
MGTHPSGPSTTLDNKLLSTVLTEDPNLVGYVPAGYVSSDLPFLFKVLSIRTALSIQVNKVNFY